MRSETVAPSGLPKVESLPFAITSGEYLKTLLSLWLPRWWWLPVIPIVAALMLAFILSDERFALIAVMLAFIVVPMGMSFLYTYYMLTPEARRAILKKKVTVMPGRALVLEYESVHSEDSEVGERFPVPRPETIAWDDILRVKFTRNYVVYVLKSQRLQFVMVPWETLPRDVSPVSLS